MVKRTSRNRLTITKRTFHAGPRTDRETVPPTDADDLEVFTMPGASEAYGLLIEQMSEGALILSREGEILYANECVARILQLPLERLAGKTLRSFVAEEDQLAIADLIDSAGRGSSRGEIAVRPATGAPVLLRLGLSRMAAGSKAVVGVVATDLTDSLQSAEPERRPAERITALEAANLQLRREAAERRKDAMESEQLNADLEQRLAARTAELQASHRELEAFACAVSHDLRAPLRSIDGFSQALLADYSATLDAEGQDFLRGVRAAARHMGHVIDGLLRLSHLARAPIQRVQVDLSSLAQSLASVLTESEPGRQAIFTIASEAYAVGDTRLLRMVMENLLGNAWKFTSRKAQARIEFGTRPLDGEVEYFVRDDGAGFDPANAERLFGLFQRMDSAAEFPGTGIGLATVQRIIQRHGGRVWAQGAPNRGATFHFTLPSANPIS